MRNPRVLLYVALVLAILNLIHKAEPQQTLPLVHADYPLCIKMRPGPLDKPHRTISGRAPVSDLT